MPPKRKATNSRDESDDDEPAYGKQILPVANLPATFDGEPVDGLQYLFTVRREFSRLPHTTRVANPYELPPAPSPPPQDNTAPRESRLPSPEWRTSFDKRFRNFRNNIAQPVIHIVAGPSAPNGGRKLLPDKKDRECWWAFLQGLPESEWNPPKRPKVDKERRRQHGRSRDTDASTEGWTPVHPPPSEPPTAGASATLGGAQTAWRGAHLPHDYERRERLGAASGAFAVPETYSISMAPELPTRNPTYPTPEMTPTPATANARKPPEPTPVLLNLIDHRYAVHLLMYLTYWISQHLEHLTSAPTPPPAGARSSSPSLSPHPIAPVHLRWVFALLARVDDVPSADETAQLRALARACVGLIKEHWSVPHAPTDVKSDDGGQMHRGMNEESALVASCWMAVAAVAGIWAQWDLWADAEDTLAFVATAI